MINEVVKQLLIAINTMFPNDNKYSGKIIRV